MWITTMRTRIKRYPALTLSGLTTGVAVAAFLACAAAGWPFPPLDEEDFGCEQRLRNDAGGAWFAQPANSVSNIAYIIVGLLIAASTDTNVPAKHWTNNSNYVTRIKAIPTLLACTLCLLGPGSASLHASLTVVGQLVDLACMSLVAAVGFVYSTSRLFRLERPRTIFALYTAIVTMLVSWVFLTADPQNESKMMTVMAMLLVSFLIELYIRVARRQTTTACWQYLFAAVGCTAMGVLIWILSKSKNPLCISDSFFQGHACWHVLSAISIGFWFLYALSENEDREGKDGDKASFSENEECDKEVDDGASYAFTSRTDSVKSSESLEEDTAV